MSYRDDVKPFVGVVVCPGCKRGLQDSCAYFMPRARVCARVYMHDGPCSVYCDQCFGCFVVDFCPKTRKHEEDPSRFPCQRCGLKPAEGNDCFVTALTGRGLSPLCKRCFDKFSSEWEKKDVCRWHGNKGCCSEYRLLGKFAIASLSTILAMTR